MKACPICSSRVAKPACGVPVGDLPREGFPSQFDLALHVSLLEADLHTPEHSQYCRTVFLIGSSLQPSPAHFWLPLRVARKDSASCIAVQLRSTRAFPEKKAYDRTLLWVF